MEFSPEAAWAGALFAGRVLVPHLVSSLVIVLFVLSSFLESVSGVCVFLGVVNTCINRMDLT